MKLIDLSQTIEVGMAQFPGSPPIAIDQICHINSDGYQLTEFRATVHTGTHCDAPAHFIEGGLTIEQLSLDCFIGEAVLVDVSTYQQRALPATILDEVAISAQDILVLRSNISLQRNQPAYINDYPYLSSQLAERIVSLNVKAVAIDFLSPDPLDDDSAHKILLANNVLLIENLINLDKINTERFMFSAAPLIIKGAEGGFCRAYAII